MVLVEDSTLGVVQNPVVYVLSLPISLDSGRNGRSVASGSVRKLLCRFVVTGHRSILRWASDPATRSTCSGGCDVLGWNKDRYRIGIGIGRTPNRIG